MTRTVLGHEPWVGTDYAAGVGGWRLLIVGFSHYGEMGVGLDDEDFTRIVVKRYAIEQPIPFFNAIGGYFDQDPPCNLWRRVAFMNTLPWSVGDEDEKFSYGDADQWRAVPERVSGVLNLLTPHPQKAIVFTSKGWNGWPAYTGSIFGELQSSDGGTAIPWGCYRLDNGGQVCAYGLRHPQGATLAVMRNAVAAIMSHDPLSQAV